MSAQPLRVFVGYDASERRAWEICAASMRHHASAPVSIEALDAAALSKAGVYRRTYWANDDGQMFDSLDGRPFSTQFAFTRFVVPALCQWKGRALFCDSDFLWRGDVAKLFELFNPRYAVQVVKHDFRPREERKMRGQAQVAYPRKAWSSLMLWNCEHPATEMLTPYQVSHFEGSWLHQFKWLEDEQIGALPEEWNWLEGHSDLSMEPKAVHFTKGTPDMPGHEEVAFSQEWWAWDGKLLEAAHG